MNKQLAATMTVY